MYAVLNITIPLYISFVNINGIPKMYAVLNITWFTQRPDDDPAGSKHVANSTINSK